MKRRFITLGISLLFALLFPFLVLCTDYPSFGVIGDTKIGMVEAVYKQFLLKMRERDISLIFITGDVIDRPGDESQWKRFIELTGENFTVHIAPGNHDINNYKSLNVYKEMVLRPPYYAFYEGDTQFIILCTEVPDEIGRITGRQLIWLKEELKKPFAFRFIFLHRPLFPCFGYGYCLDVYKDERDALHKLFVDSKVSAVCTGHEHLYNRSERDKITYIITGGGGSRLLTFKEEYGGFFHYIVAKRQNEGYIFTVYDIDENIRDEFTIRAQD